jgi:hypothetical protein
MSTQVYAHSDPLIELAYYSFKTDEPSDVESFSNKLNALFYQSIEEIARHVAKDFVEAVIKGEINVEDISSSDLQIVANEYFWSYSIIDNNGQIELLPKNLPELATRGEVVTVKDNQGQDQVITDQETITRLKLNDFASGFMAYLTVSPQSYPGIKNSLSWCAEETSINVHTHPNETSFSPADIFYRTKEFSLLATKEHIYALLFERGHETKPLFDYFEGELTNASCFEDFQNSLSSQDKTLQLLSLLETRCAENSLFSNYYDHYSFMIDQMTKSPEMAQYLAKVVNFTLPNNFDDLGAGKLLSFVDEIISDTITFSTLCFLSDNKTLNAEVLCKLADGIGLVAYKNFQASYDIRQDFGISSSLGILSQITAENYDTELSPVTQQYDAWTSKLKMFFGIEVLAFQVDELLKDSPDILNSYYFKAQ